MFDVREIVVGLVCCFALQAQTGKQFKPGEIDLYNPAVQDLNGANFEKAVRDLDAWKAKYPESDYQDERLAFYVQAWTGTNQPAKALDAAGALMARDLSQVFPGPEGQAAIVRLLYNATWAISHLENPTPEELTAGEKGARQLLAYDRQLSGVSAEKWAEARAEMRDKAAAALLRIAMAPGTRAMAKHPPDCAAAEAVYIKTLDSYPDKAVVSWELGRALNCEAKPVPAIYEFVRAATLDATLGGAQNDPKKIRDFAENAYVKFHGSAEGLEKVRQQVTKSPLPPPDFQIRSASEIAEEKNAEFEKTNPQLALWMKIRGALTAADGERYFESDLKGAGVPQLTGKLVEAKPACRPRELLVSVPLPDSPASGQAEIELKLDKPLAGKPEVNSSFYWEGVPSAFTREPFLLTMDAPVAKIKGLKIAPCASSR